MINAAGYLLEPQPGPLSRANSLIKQVRRWGFSKLAQFKIVVSDPATGKSEVLDAKDSTAQLFMGRRLGDTVDLNAVGQNYKVKITGGSDKAGFPMRADVLGSGKRYVLMSEGIGFRNSAPGEKRRKLVRGGLITEEIYQLNAVKVQQQRQSSESSPK
jgi:small subunit ribosomal protein S6e